MGFKEIISLLSGVALFLFGMTMMGDGLKKVAGNKLELLLFRLSNTSLKGLLLGTGVTAVIQSSAATSVMSVGFVNSGMMKVRQAISIILGAILGTSVTGWVISLSYIESGGSLASIFSTATLTGLIAIVGIYLRVFQKKIVLRHVGDIMMGFAILMFGMSTMSGSVSGLGKQPWFTATLTSMSSPLLGIIVGAAFTAILQSASAAVGIIQALSVTGAMTFESALPLLMGVTIGASVPVLLSALGANTDGRRAAYVYPVATVVSVMISAAIFYVIHAIFRFPFMETVMNPFSLALVNTILRLVMVLLLLPYEDLLETIVSIIIREKPSKDEEQLVQLEDRFVNHPSLAIEQSRLAVNDMAARTEESLRLAFRLMDNFDEEIMEHVKKLEQVVDIYEDRLGSYLVKLTGQELTPRQNEDISKILHTLSDFERMSDHALNIAENAQEIHDKGFTFSDDARFEIDVVSKAVIEIVQLTTESFTGNDLATASRVEPLEEVIDQLCDEMKLRHVERLQRGICTIAQGFVFNDLMTNCERVGDHCSNIAVAVIELESDVFDTHEYLNAVKNARSPEFEAYLEDYQNKYQLEEPAA